MENYKMIETNILNILKDKTKVNININELKVNDHVYIEFYPDSQKYIYELVPKLGIISSINNNEESYPNITILNYEGIYEDLLHGSYSFYGHTLGYDYSLFLLKK
jgi:hypothetical protein